MSEVWKTALTEAAHKHGVSVDFGPQNSDAVYFDVVSELGRRKCALSGCYLAMAHDSAEIAKEADRMVRLRAREIALDHAAKVGAV